MIWSSVTRLVPGFQRTSRGVSGTDHIDNHPRIAARKPLACVPAWCSYSVALQSKPSEVSELNQERRVTVKWVFTQTRPQGGRVTSM